VFAALSGFAVAALAVGGYASSSTVLADARDSAIADLDAEIANTEAKLYTLKQEKLAELQTELASEEAKRVAGASALEQTPSPTVPPSDSLESAAVPMPASPAVPADPELGLAPSVPAEPVPAPPIPEDIFSLPTLSTPPVAPPDSFVDAASAADGNDLQLIGGVSFVALILIGVSASYALYTVIFRPEPAPRVNTLRPSGAAAATTASGKRSAPTIFFEGLQNLAKDPWGWLDSPIDMPKGSVVPCVVRDPKDADTPSVLPPSALEEKVKRATSLLGEEEASP
jgi:hypothetical protein